MHVYTGTIELMEHTYFASRELGILAQTEPLLGNYALTYALSLATAPFRVPSKSGPRYAEDLGPLNARGLYVTPGTFKQDRLRFVLSQFNAQTDTYYSRYDQGAIATTQKTARAANFPQAGRIRMLGQGSVAVCHVLNSDDSEDLFLPAYIRLGKFMSKARLQWQRQTAREVTQDNATLPLLLNAVDLPPGMVPRTFIVHNVHPAPLLERAELSGSFWELDDGTLLPVGMRYGVDDL
jgi:CRISPR-associated protein Csc1